MVARRDCVTLSERSESNGSLRVSGVMGEAYDVAIDARTTRTGDAGVVLDSFRVGRRKILRLRSG